MIIKDEIADARDIMKTALTLQELFHTPISLDTYVFNLSGSIGVATYPTDSNIIDDLLRYADAAMYAVKHSGQKDDYRIFDRSLVETVEKHRLLEEKLQAADPEQDFILYYQPQVDKLTGKLVGAEVFPRLKGNEEYTAAELLPVAEETGLMSRLGIWIADTAIRQIDAWNREYGKTLSITLNLAPLQLLDVEFIESLERIVEELKIQPGYINLDVSNEVIMGAAGSAKETLKALHHYGFHLSLNNFGGGNINLSYILDCGFDGIHLSHSLIARAQTEPETVVLIRSILAIARELSITASAVGIETKEQAQMMQELGVLTLQGFFCGRPQEKEQFETLLQNGGV